MRLRRKKDSHQSTSPHPTVVVDIERLARVGSVGEAQLFIPFAIREPAGLGVPDLVAATPPKTTSPDRAILFRYGATPYGPVAVMQQGGEHVVTIRGGIEALLVITPTGSVLRWIEQGVAFTVTAPSANRNQLLELAEKV